MNITAKNLLLAAQDGYRDSDTEYRLYVGHEDTKAARDAIFKRLEKTDLEYKLQDSGVFLYVTLDQAAEYGLTENDLDYCNDLRDYHRRQEEEQREREQRERETLARLLGNFEATLAVYVDDPAKRYQVAKHMVDTAKEVL
ncbi:hypothetical protein [Limnobacter sp.]|uniref:hypothetical protein n=1 Tax=Limnobacter sp. TaxID=2003368 RepID=UPI0025B7F29B|nr:hypothetical protein [Limnobacter sp.]